jgi:hypothetical protein
MSTSRVLLNGIAGSPIVHQRGLRQGEPLSLLLFVLAIDPLSHILEAATTHGLLHKLRGWGTILRTSFYADDAAVFVAPIKQDIQNLATILHNFGEVTGLCTNFLKSSVVPIKCGNIDLDDILEDIPTTRASFPLRYLGLPLSVWSLCRRDFQHLEDKCTGKLPPWIGKFTTMAVRPSLVKSVLSSIAIYHLTPLNIAPGTLQFINKLERTFLWPAKKTTTGAKCKVNWENVCRPKIYGGLGVLHFEKFAMALRLCWPWLEWHDNGKIWVGFNNPCSKEDMIFYVVPTSRLLRRGYDFLRRTNITLGNVQKTQFWHAPWLGGRSPRDIAPKIFECSKRKKWLVQQALVGDAWVLKVNLDTNFTMDHLTQFIELWVLLHGVNLVEDVEDTISWKLTSNGQYSAASAYKLQFYGLEESSMYNIIWKAWAPPKVKNHAWLAYQNRLWTRIDFKIEVGQIVDFAPCASKHGSPMITSLSIAASPFGYGISLRIGLASMDFIRGNGWGYRSRSGGPYWRKAVLLIARPLPL